jgi:hypothetical protein
VGIRFKTSGAKKTTVTSFDKSFGAPDKRTSQVRAGVDAREVADANAPSDAHTRQDDALHPFRSRGRDRGLRVYSA